MSQMNDNFIDRDLIKHLAGLARLGLTEQEQEKFSKQLSSIVDYVAKVQQIKGQSSYQPAGLINGLTDNLRKDQPRSCLTQDEVLANAPEKQVGHFKVKVVLE